jgi:hypothetical protein
LCCFSFIVSRFVQYCELVLPGSARRRVHFVEAVVKIGWIRWFFGVALVFSYSGYGESITYHAPVKTQPVYTGEQVYVPFKPEKEEWKQLRGHNHVPATGMWVSKEQYDIIKEKRREMAHIIEGGGTGVAYEIDHSRMSSIESQLDRNPYDDYRYGITRRVVNMPSTQAQTGRNDEYVPEFGRFQVNGNASQSAFNTTYPIHQTLVYDAQGRPLVGAPVTTFDAQGRAITHRPTVTQNSAGLQQGSPYLTNPISPVPPRIEEHGHYPQASPPSVPSSQASRGFRVFRSRVASPR